MDAMAQDSKSDVAGAQSVDRALSLLSLVATGGGADVPMTFLTEKTGLSRPTVRRLMLALIRAGLVDQDAVTRNYALGPESHVVGLMAQRRFPLLDVAMESVIAIATESGDSSFLSIRRGLYSVCLHREEGAYPLRTQALQVGARHPLGIGAGAMAMLAALPDDEAAYVKAENAPIMDERYPNYTEAAIDAHIAATRERGWALNPGLYLANSWGMGVALRAPSGDVLGSLSIAALDFRLTPERQPELAALLKREATKVEIKLKKRLRSKGP
jgi:DNA-binding IclR family transcriptional regulator